MTFTTNVIACWRSRSTRVHKMAFANDGDVHRLTATTAERYKSCFSYTYFMFIASITLLHINTLFKNFLQRLAAAIVNKQSTEISKARQAQSRSRSLPYMPPALPPAVGTMEGCEIGAEFLTVADEQQCKRTLLVHTPSAGLAKLQSCFPLRALKANGVTTKLLRQDGGRFVNKRGRLYSNWRRLGTRV